MERVFKLPFKLILKDKAKANKKRTKIIYIFTEIIPAQNASNLHKLLYCLRSLDM